MDSKKRIFGQKDVSEICHWREQTAMPTFPLPNAPGLSLHTDLWGLTQFSALGRLFPLRKARPFSSTHTQRMKPIRSRGIYKLLYTARHSDSAKPTTCMSYTLCSFKLPDGIQAVSTFSPWVAWTLPKKENRINAVCCIKNCIEQNIFTSQGLAKSRLISIVAKT